MARKALSRSESSEERTSRLLSANKIIWDWNNIPHLTWRALRDFYHSRNAGRDSCKPEFDQTLSEKLAFKIISYVSIKRLASWSVWNVWRRWYCPPAKYVPCQVTRHDAGDNIRVCLVSGLLKPSKGISKSDMGLKGLALASKGVYYAMPASPRTNSASYATSIAKARDGVYTAKAYSLPRRNIKSIMQNSTIWSLSMGVHHYLLRLQKDLLPRAAVVGGRIVQKVENIRIHLSCPESNRLWPNVIENWWWQGTQSVHEKTCLNN